MTALIRKRLSLVLIVSGAIMATAVLWPIVASQLKFSFSPSSRLIDPTAVSGNRPFLVVNLLGLPKTDYTQATNWFDISPPATTSAKVSPFTLPIPRVKMTNIEVATNHLDLKKGPLLFPGTALPGDRGNAVIFGHSSLPYLYRSGNPLTVFNPLPEVKIGDEIIVTSDSVTYKYVVRSTREVQPNQIDVLSQNKNRRELTLVTCVPLGTYWRRFVATAELVN